MAMLKLLILLASFSSSLYASAQEVSRLNYYTKIIVLADANQEFHSDKLAEHLVKKLKEDYKLPAELPISGKSKLPQDCSTLVCLFKTDLIPGNSNSSGAFVTINFFNCLGETVYKLRGDFVGEMAAYRVFMNHQVAVNRTLKEMDKYSYQYVKPKSPILDYTALQNLVGSYEQTCKFNDESEYKNYFDTLNRAIDPIEGIYTVSTKSEYYFKFMDNENTEYHDYSIVIVKTDKSAFTVCYLSSEVISGEETIAENDEEIDGFDQRMFYLTSIKPTSIQTNYIIDYNYIFLKEKLSATLVTDLNGYCSHEYSLKGGLLSKMYNLMLSERAVDQINYTIEYIKTYPLHQHKSSEESASLPESKPTKSGTSILINNEGYIITNYHVIEGGKFYFIKGIDGNFNISIPAELIATDKAHDLALLRIKADKYPACPIKIQFSQQDVASNILYLGFPLRSILGEELKVTSGIISSRSGLEGDISYYQLDAQGFGGNSGGPVFNDMGVLVGIITSGIAGHDITYALKSGYLVNFLENADCPYISSLSTQAQLTNSEIVKRIKPAVYIVEVE